MVNEVEELFYPEVEEKEEIEEQPIVDSEIDIEETLTEEQHDVIEEAMDDLFYKFGENIEKLLEDPQE